MSAEKDLKADAYDTNVVPAAESPPPGDRIQEREVFKDTEAEGHVNFKTLGWIKATFYFAKMTFAIGVLSIPTSIYILGGGLGIASIIFWSIHNTYMASLQGAFKLKHPSVHMIPDATEIIMSEWGFSKRVSRLTRNVFEFQYWFTWIICSAVSGLTLATAFNAVSHHAICTVYFNIVAMIVLCLGSSFRRISHIAYLTIVGFFCIVVSVLIVVISVTQKDRPAYAPQTGDYDLGVYAAPALTTTFASGLGATLSIFSASGNISGFLPVISELRRPQDYYKALYGTMGFIFVSYMSFCTVTWWYCGKWVTSPALGAAGDHIKVIAYAIAIPGLIAGGITCLHTAIKSSFVRILRNSDHLTRNTKTHWITWIGCCISCSTLGWIVCEAIPFFQQLISLTGSLCFGPVSIIVPTAMWFSMNRGAWSKGGTKGKAKFTAHMVGQIWGWFVTIAGTYAVILDIVNAYKNGTVSHAFACDDNSATIVAT